MANRATKVKIGATKTGKKKASKPLQLLANLAEEVGFEPTVPCGTPHFECGSL